jgi:hypothetical protein
MSEGVETQQDENKEASQPEDKKPNAVEAKKATGKAQKVSVVSAETLCEAIRKMQPDAEVITLPSDIGVVATPSTQYLVDASTGLRYTTNILTPCPEVRAGSWVQVQIAAGLLTLRQATQG